MSKQKRSYYQPGLWQRLRQSFMGGNPATNEALPEQDVLEYLESSYPSNHNYVLKQGKLIPLRKLAGRYKGISAHYPADMDSLLDISCSKGYFNFDAVVSFGARRSMGIDVIEKELLACAKVKAYLGDSVTQFEQLRLHELAANIDDFGGPFEVALLINCYQYLYFGSSRFPGAYLSHDKIFRDLRKVCNRRLVFSNRLEVARLQEYPARIAAGPDMQEVYDEHAVLTAASRYFQVSQAGKLGRYPLWTLDAKAADQ